jgi:pimeloyl-ACP methyl ester carboxylesterase
MLFPNHLPYIGHMDAPGSDIPDFDSGRALTSEKGQTAPMRYRWLALILLGGLWFSATAAVIAPPPALAAQFTAGPCRFHVPAGLQITCGYLSVPEDHGATKGRLIRLAVAIAHTARAPRQADPVVYLAGGPGSGAVASTPALALGWAAFLAHRDLIVVDQRGTGFSQPSLACTAQDHTPPAPGELQTPGGRAAAEYRDLLRCRDRLTKAEVRLAAYTTAASARDLRDLRIALGYPRWNLLGISYGTRLALAALRVDAQGIRSVILDSVYPPQENLFTAMPGSLDRTLQMLYADCAAEAPCRKLAPTLRTTLAQLIAHLDVRPVDVAVRRPDGHLVSMRIDGARLIEIVLGALSQSRLIPLLPLAIVNAAKGDYSLIREFERQREQRAQGHSAAMYYAVECSEDLALAGVSARQAAAARYPLLTGYYRGVQEFTPASGDLCQAWSVIAPTPDVSAPVVSDVPALLLAGEYDPITPPSWADTAAATLRHSEVYHARGTGHAVITRGACPRKLIATFLDRLTARSAAACLAGIGTPVFAGR